MQASDNIVQFPDAQQLEERAAEWALRIAEGGLSGEEQAAFEAWQAASARHREAFARLAHLWKHCDVLAELGDHAAADVTRASLAEHGSPSDAPAGPFNRRTLLAASVAVFALLTTSSLNRQTMVMPAPMVSAVYEEVAQTAVGERRTVSLPDGSGVELNTASEVHIHYTVNARLVRLMRGEAHFTVASDPQRPFSVYVADRVVTAVGTAFSVQLRRDAVEVTVAEGRVSVAESDIARPSAVSAQPNAMLPSLEAGQRALLSEGQPQVAALAPEELNRKLAWRQGMLAFAGEPLLEVLQEIGRYTDIRLEITDPALRDLPVAGRLRIDDVESMLQALQLMADVQVERLNEHHVRLRPR